MFYCITIAKIQAFHFHYKITYWVKCRIFCIGVNPFNALVHCIPNALNGFKNKFHEK